MRTLKAVLDRSLIAQAVVVFVLGVAVYALLRHDAGPVLWVVQSALITAMTIGFIAVQRRRTGRAAGTDARGFAELNRKIRHRDVPRDPEERAVMRRLVEAQLGRMERGGRWLPYWLGCMGLIAVGLLVLGITTGSLVFPLAFAVGTAAFCFWVVWMRRRAMELHRHMRAALEEPS
ncbi:hypothetical protein AB0M10_23090 [Streptomyces sp. NPDC051840]|uniref:hypothetical protein n=1 Tax=unclassified Streptomyces TaxID=2593676 RepID=UPI003436C04B